MRTATTFLILASLAAGPAAASEVISFDEIAAQNANSPSLTEEYAHLGVHFSSVDDGSTWDGLSRGDPGGWEIEGTNGSAFVGFNGRSYRLTASFDAPVPAFSIDVTAASGSPMGVAFTLEGYRAGALVERNAVTLGGLNQWMTVGLTTEVDQVVMMGSPTGFHPFGIDNMHWGVDAPQAPPHIDAAIDVRPGSAENPVNPGSSGTLPVALLGSESLDVMDVDPASLALGVAGAPALDFEYADVNGDGLTDLVAHYSTAATGTAYGDTSMCLTGATKDGVELAGCDAIRTVPKESASAQKAKGGKR
ncbi:MAG TPA: hypothetical protein VKH41_03595 [Myxococcota bacterium]|nr:hypothetical protein [Myxococcota bacterium]